MPQAGTKVKFHRLSPDPNCLFRIVDDFTSRGEGLIAPLEDDRIAALQPMMPDDDGVELVTFGMLVRRLALHLNLAVRTLPAKSILEAAWENACRSVVEGSAFFLSREQVGLRRAMNAEWDEVKQVVSTEPEWGALLNEVSPLLGAKLTELRRLAQLVEQTLESLGRQGAGDLLAALVEEDVPTDHALPPVLLVVDHRIDESGLRLMRWLAAQHAQIEVAWISSPEVMTKAETLLAEIPEAFSASYQMMGTWQEHLFGMGEAVSPCEATIISAPDPLFEAERVVRECLAALRDGCEPTDLCIYARDLNTYGPLFQSVARRFGLPLSVRTTVPLLSERFTSFVLNLLDAFTSADVRDLMKPLRSSFGPIEASDKKRLEEVLQSIHALGPDPWRNLAAWADDQEPWVGTLMEWRAKALERPARLEEHRRNLQALLELLEPETEKIDENTLRAAVALQRPLSAFSKVHEIEGREALSYQEFVEWLRDAWTEEVFAYPAVEGGVRLVRSAAEIGVVRFVCAVGLVEGTLPRRPSEAVIFNDSDRNEINEALRLAIGLQTSIETARAERVEFAHLCCAASDKLLLSSYRSSSSGDHVATAYLNEVFAKCRSTKVERILLDDIVPPARDIWLLPDLAVAEAISQRPVYDVSPALKAEAVRAQFALGAEAAFTPEQYAVSMDCSFQFFARYRLGLEGRRSNFAWTRLMQLPYVAKLPRQPDEEAARIALEAGLANLLDQVKRTIPAWEYELIRVSGLRLIQGWIAREFEARNCWPRKPAGPEEAEILNEKVLGIRFNGKLPTMSTLNGVRTLHVFHRSDQLDSNSRNDLNVTLLNQYQLMAAALRKPGDGGIFLEVDTVFGQPGGERILYSVGKDVHRPPQMKGFTSRPLGGSKDADARPGRLRGDLEEAHRNIINLDVRPNPGDDKCRRCSLGELCRRSAAFSDAIEGEEVDALD